MKKHYLIDYVIVSKDAGYDNVIAFWRSEQGVAIERRKQLCSLSNGRGNGMRCMRIAVERD